MNKTSFLSLFSILLFFATPILSTITVAEPQPPTTPMLKGCICAQNLETLPQFHVYYQGESVLSDKDGFFSFPIEATNDCGDMSLLLCKTFNPEYKGVNTVKRLRCNVPHIFFHLTKNRRNHQWQIEQSNDLQNHNKIPKNCVIISLKPSLFGNLEQWSFSSNTQFVMLPKIILREDIKEGNIKKSKSVTRASIKSELNALDTKVFHRNKEVLKQTPLGKETVTISLTT
jgi:hypothetical protein